MKKILAALFFIPALAAFAELPLYPYPKTTAPAGGFAGDGETARQLAEIIVAARFGKGLMETYRPYKVRYVSQWKSWEVYGGGRPVRDGKAAVMGGEPHVVIRKADGAVLSCWMTK